MSSILTGARTPATPFAELGLPDPILRVLADRGITEPLPIQATAIADVLAGKDVSAEAPTGSGKTLAFALPMAAMVSRAAPRRPRALVLAPTRELAAQITAELAPLLGARGLKAHAFYGGVSFGSQRKALTNCVEVAVACPGRLEDLIRAGQIRLSDVEIAVVDEADRMADMGFLPAVGRILDATSAERQTLLFSATLDGDVEVLVRRFQRRPVRHKVLSEEQDLRRVSHRFDTVAHSDRVARCAEIVGSSRSTLVFVRTKHGADRLSRQLGRLGVDAVAIHGDRSQPQRDRALAAFRAGKVQALVATDVAARGIHIDDVACVVHFDLPADAKSYLHRSGRTARAGARGAVVAFVTPDQQAAGDALRRALDIAGEPVACRSAAASPASALGTTPTSLRSRGARRRLDPAHMTNGRRDAAPATHRDRRPTANSTRFGKRPGRRR